MGTELLQAKSIQLSLTAKFNVAKFNVNQMSIFLHLQKFEEGRTDIPYPLGGGVTIFAKQGFKKYIDDYFDYHFLGYFLLLLSFPNHFFVSQFRSSHQRSSVKKAFLEIS